jgi:antitoxin StbD
VLFTGLLKIHGVIVMTEIVLTNRIASISDLKKNPMRVVAQGEGDPVAILNRNKPAFYCVPAKAYEDLISQLEDNELNALANSRSGQSRIKVELDDL